MDHLVTLSVDFDRLKPTMSSSAHPEQRSDLTEADLAHWRTEVGRFRASEQRRRHPLGVRVGQPGRDPATLELEWPVPAYVDAGLRFDVVSGLLQRAGPAPAWCWVTRPGVPERHDVDLQWYAAALAAFDASQVTLRGFLALTRTGWLDVRSGERRVWKRLRL